MSVGPPSVEDNRPPPRERIPAMPPKTESKNTERKNAEEELRRSEARYRSLTTQELSCPAAIGSGSDLVVASITEEDGGALTGRRADGDGNRPVDEIRSDLLNVLRRRVPALVAS